MPALGAVSSLATSCAVGVASDLTSVPDDRARMLPVHPVIAELFPRGGLRRGSTVAVRGSTSLLFALLARATETGSWAAVVGMPDLGLRAAAELGVAVERLVLVRHPGADQARVVAALLDGMDMVTVDPARLTDSQAHRLSARARHRGAVLVSTGPWPGADLELTQETASWFGLGDGHGHLAARELRVRARGRGAAARPTEVWLHLPAVTGAMAGATKDPFGTLPVPKGHFAAAVRRPPLPRDAVDRTSGTLPVSTAPAGSAGVSSGAPPVSRGSEPAWLDAGASRTLPDLVDGTLGAPAVADGPAPDPGVLPGPRPAEAVGRSRFAVPLEGAGASCPVEGMFDSSDDPDPLTLAGRGA